MSIKANYLCIIYFFEYFFIFVFAFVLLFFFPFKNYKTQLFLLESEEISLSIPYPCFFLIFF